MTEEEFLKRPAISNQLFLTICHLYLSLYLYIIIYCCFCNWGDLGSVGDLGTFLFSLFRDLGTFFKSPQKRAEHASH